MLEKTLESPLDSKEIQPIHPKGNQSWIFIERTDSNTLDTWCKELTHWKRPWCWERLRAGGEVGDRGWHGWMASLTQWTWVWANWKIVKDREGWHAAVHWVTKNQIQLSDWTTNETTRYEALISKSKVSLPIVLRAYPHDHYQQAMPRIQIIG